MNRQALRRLQRHVEACKTSHYVGSASVEDIEAAVQEIHVLRKAFVEVFPADDGFTEHMDELISLGLLVEVPADEHFKEWWDPDAETMYVWRWSDLAAEQQLQGAPTGRGKPL